jgi:hypothetical protein
MARKNAPAKYGGHANGFFHREKTRLWARRKKNEACERLEGMIEKRIELGGSRALGRQWRHLCSVKAAAAKAERELLATTSLKDLIK